MFIEEVDKAKLERSLVDKAKNGQEQVCRNGYSNQSDLSNREAK